MSTRSIQWLTAALAATVSLSGCAIEEMSDQEVAEEEAAEEEGSKEMRYVGARVLAAVERPNRAVVRFLASDTDEGVGCDELVPADGVARASRSGADGRCCLELYLDLTERTAPVPAELVAASRLPDVQQRLVGRPIVESVAAPLRSAELLPFSGDQETTPHSCSGDSGSQAHFAAEHCDFSGGSDVINWCDPEGWSDHIRTSNGGKRRDSFSEILSCTALADVIHEYWNGTSWPNAYSITNIPDDHYHWSHWEGSAKWQRRVHSYRVIGAGFIRVHTIFFN